MNSASEQFDYRDPFPSYFGGVTSMTPQQFNQANGFSNVFYGWGCEDRDLYNRIRLAVGMDTWKNTPEEGR